LFYPPDPFRYLCRMKALLSFIVICNLLIACKNVTSYNPDQFFSKVQQREIIKQTVRYSAKLPPEANHNNKFDKQFDWYYDIAAEECDFRECAKKDDHYYFLMTRKARSIWPAREGIGGIFKLDTGNKLIDYEEVFRTWKMTEDTLNTRAFELFDLMVNGKDLESYRSKYKGDRYIEFPDDYYVFDRERKIWVRK